MTMKTDLFARYAYHTLYQYQALIAHVHTRGSVLRVFEVEVLDHSPDAVEAQQLDEPQQAQKLEPAPEIASLSSGHCVGAAEHHRRVLPRVSADKQAVLVVASDAVLVPGSA